MNKMIIYHGSDHIIKAPDIRLGKKYNDYGQGFYCTEDVELAKEWACKSNKDGFVNKYEMNPSGLKILNLNSDGYTILNWIALLLKNRTFFLDNDIQRRARTYIIDNFSVAVENYDVIIGYRADDSYFSFAESFVSNTLSLSALNRALQLGNLGEQIALVSEKAFDKITFKDAETVEKLIYYPKFSSRDKKAREDYVRYQSVGIEALNNEIFILDIIRQEMKNDDPRIQRIVSE